jgi:hypothetical protein
MTNTIKQTLNNRLEVVTQELATLAAEKNSRTIERVKEEFQDALVLLPEIDLKVTYHDTVYFNFDGKEILSIQSKGGYGGREISYYLNTYSTWIEDDFELKRLIFNGRVAGKLLADKETYSRIFAKVEEFEEKVSKFQEEMWQLQHAIREIEHKEASEAKEKALKSFFEGNEIKFDKMETIQYARGRYDTINRVVGIKMLAASKDKSRVNIEFECQNWNEEGTTKVSRENVKLTSIQYYI